MYAVTFGNFSLLVILVIKNARKSIKATEIITAAEGEDASALFKKSLIKTSPP
jgi:hypothetical protein